MYSHPALATRESGDIHESRDRSVFFLQQKRRDIKDIPAVVENALLSTALGDLLLLLLFDLGGLRLDFASTGERAVNYMGFTGNNMSDSSFSKSSGSNDLFPCCLEVGVLEDVGGDEKIATVQSLPTRDESSNSAENRIT